MGKKLTLFYAVKLFNWQKVGRMEREKESVLPSVGEERIGGAYTLRNDSEEELFREMLTPT